MPWRAGSARCQAQGYWLSVCPGAEACVPCSVLGQIYGATDCGTVISMGILANYGFDCTSDLSMLTVSFPNGLRAVFFTRC